jgi:hypothetical protein
MNFSPFYKLLAAASLNRGAAVPREFAILFLFGTNFCLTNKKPTG